MMAGRLTLCCHVCLKFCDLSSCNVLSKQYFFLSHSQPWDKTHTPVIWVSQSEAEVQHTARLGRPCLDVWWELIDERIEVLCPVLYICVPYVSAHTHSRDRDQHFYKDPRISLSQVCAWSYCLAVKVTYYKINCFCLILSYTYQLHQLWCQGKAIQTHSSLAVIYLPFIDSVQIWSTPLYKLYLSDGWASTK